MIDLFDNLEAATKQVPIWPSQHLHALLSGKTTWLDAPAPIKSWAMFYIHDAALQILALPKDKRETAIGKFPETLRPLLKAEIMRLWALR